MKSGLVQSRLAIYSGTDFTLYWPCNQALLNLSAEFMALNVTYFIAVTVKMISATVNGPWAHKKTTIQENIFTEIGDQATWLCP